MFSCVTIPFTAEVLQGGAADGVVRLAGRAETGSKALHSDFTIDIIEGAYMKYRITDFIPAHIKTAQAIAYENYEEERRHVPSLPAIAEVPSLLPYAENGLGVAAFTGDTLLGFLCAVPPFAQAFGSTDAVGVFSPAGANGAVSDDRAAIYAQMYEASGEKWAAAGASSHAVSLYAHDRETQLQFFRYGFGHRCTSAIRCMEDCKEAAAAVPDILFTELAPEERFKALPFEHRLDAHMAASPTFILRPSKTEAAYAEENRETKARIFAAYAGKEMIAFLKTSLGGEAFICDNPGYFHITGAFCLPEHRGKGVYANLLRFAVQKLREDGIVYLGVDYESINPSADRFWNRHFSVYTHSVVRRIDEHVFRRFGSGL